MAERYDQAEGLRRIFNASRGGAVAVFAGSRGAGATTCVVNLAAALAEQGRRVLAVDENRGRNIAELLGLEHRRDFRDAVEGRCALGDVLVSAPHGVRVIAAADAARKLSHGDRRLNERALESFLKLDETADVVLLDARNDADDPSSFASAARDIVVVVSTASSSITGGYALVKRMTRRRDIKRFHLLVNRAESDRVAKQVQANIATAASKHLGIDFDYVGAVPHDPELGISARIRERDNRAATTTARFHAHAAAISHAAASQQYSTRLDNFLQRAIYGNAVGAGV
jgi:flagellar biosynthesis protein FlhG